jgi:O-antigen ligase
VTPAAIGGAAARRPFAVRRTGFVETLIFRLFVGGLAWVPFWHGSNEPIAWGINAVLFPGLALLYEAGLMMRGKPHPVGLRHIRLPAALFLLLVLWIGLQGVAGLFPQAANPVWEMAGEASGARLAESISVNRDLTAAALVRLITGAGVFWLALQLCRDVSRALALVKAIALIGAAYAAYGLIAAKTGWLRLPDMPRGGTVSSTFINPDSYAAFAGIGLIATTGMFFRLCRRHGADAFATLRQQLAALVETIGHDGAPVLAGGFTVLAALLLTGSRGAIAATGLAIIVFVLLARRGGAGRESQSWPVSILGLALVAGTGLLFGTSLADKIAGTGVFDPNRLAVYRLTLQSIIDRPWLGWGYGTFVDVFPMYRDSSIAGSGTWSQAHNTYLETVQGLGIVFGSISIALVALLVFRCLRGALARRKNATAPLVAVGAASLVGAHALVDFSVQIQAVALTVAALLGAGLAQAEPSRVSLDDGPLDYRPACPIRDGSAGPAPRRAGRRARLTALAVATLCGYAALQGGDLALSAARVQAADDARLERGPGAMLAMGSETARRWLGLPGLNRSALDLPLAQIATLDPETGEQQAKKLTPLVAARPLSSQAWLSLAAFRLVAREPLASVLAALRLSWLTGPNEGSVRWQRGVLGLALWDTLPGDARDRTTRDLAGALRGSLAADRQATAVMPIIDGKSAEARAQIRALLAKQGVPPADLARLGLPAE